MLTSRLQNDPIEHHFGLYRMMSGAHYHVSYSQIIESERRIKLSSILKIFSKKEQSDYVSLKNMIDSCSSSNEVSDYALHLDTYLIALHPFRPLLLIVHFFNQ